MTSMATTSETEGLHHICRLCLSEESVHGVWEKADLQQWISDYLSITISTGDRISQSICAICQLRLTEFHHFRVNCQEIQSVLHSMMQDDKSNIREVSLPSAIQEQRPMKLEPETGSFPDSDHSEGLPDSVERHAIVYYEWLGDEQLEDQLDLEEIKVESRTDEESESLSEDWSSPVVAAKHGVTKNQPEKCEICNKSFSSKKNLWYHKKTMHRKKDYNCSVCGVGFSFRSNLNLHLKTEQHITKSRFSYEAENPFKCDMCQRAYPSKTRLNTHKKQNHGPKISCDYCGVKFSNRWNMQQHKLLRHPGIAAQEQPVMKGVTDVNSADRPFKCDLCQKAYTKQSALNWHNKLVHGPKALECSMCDYKCTYMYNFNRHMLNHSSRNGQ